MILASKKNARDKIIRVPPGTDKEDESVLVKETLDAVTDKPITLRGSAQQKLIPCSQSSHVHRPLLAWWPFTKHFGTQAPPSVALSSSKCSELSPCRQVGNEGVGACCQPGRGMAHGVHAFQVYINWPEPIPGPLLPSPLCPGERK